MDERFELWAKEDEYEYWRCPAGALEELTEQRDTLLELLKVLTTEVGNLPESYGPLRSPLRLAWRAAVAAVPPCQEQP